MNRREKGFGGCGLDYSGSGLEAVAGSCEYSFEVSGSIKGGEFLY
jgi:hypothetical protein